MVQDQQQATPRPAVLPLLRDRRHARAAPRRRRSGSSRYRGRVRRRLGGVARRARSPASVELGIVPAGHRRSPSGRAWVRDVGRRSPTTSAALLRPHDGGVRRLPHATPTPRSAALVDVPRAASAQLDDTLRHAHLRQRHQRRGRPARHRSTSTASPTTCPTTSPTRSARIDELGGFRAYNHYSWGWAWAGNTPLRLWKRYTWLGGMRTPLIVHWPRGIAAARRGARRSSATPIDLMPTVLDAAGVDARRRSSTASTQQPVDGASSLLPTFADADAPTPRDDAVLRDARQPRSIVPRRLEGDHRPRRQAAHRRDASSSRAAATSTTDRWALFDLDDDFAEAHDLADEHPDVVRRLERAVVGRGGAQPGAAARRQLHRPRDRDRAAAVRAPLPHRLPPRRRSGRRGRAPAARRGLPPGRRASRSRRTAPRGSSCALGDWNNGWALLPARRAPRGDVQPVRRRRTASRPRRRSRTGRHTHRLRVSHASTRTAGPSRSRSTATLRRRVRGSRPTSRSAGRSAAPGSCSATTAASPCATTTSRRSTVHRHRRPRRDRGPDARAARHRRRAGIGVAPRIVVTG